ncbi:class I SAM-dependent methyltransferase [Staphylococcus pseudintermedius]|nr:class I SAM-dependent methyltransferase [Staphylococcus pseudintermedius]
MYSSKLSEKGYHVTGIDISERSIQFAKGQSENEESDTTYLCMDIFDYNFELKYNIILMLYNMYSSFDKDSRLYLLRNIYASLDNGGKFLFDVPSMNWYDSCSEINTWDHYSKLLVNKKIVDFYKLSKYKEGVILINSIYLDEFINITNTYDWFKCFELNELLQEVESVGFKVEGIYSKTNGESYSPDSHTISLLCEK